MSIRDIAQLEQEISGDRFTLDLYNFLRSASSEKLISVKAARAKYIQAQQHYDDLQTAEAQTEAVSLLSEAAAEFDKLGDDYQSLLAQHFKMLLLSFSDGQSSLAISNKLELEARSRKYFALLLKVKSQQQKLKEYKPVNPLAELQEVGTLAWRVNDINSEFAVVHEKSKKQSGLEFLAQGIKLVTSKELENKDRQNMYSSLSEVLLKSRRNTKLAVVESGLEGALIAGSAKIRLVSAQGWRKIGENYSNIGEFTKAREYYDKALWDNAHTINATTNTAINCLAMAVAALKEKDYLGSIQYFDKVFENSNRKFDLSLELNARVNFAKALIGSGAKVKSEVAFSEAYTLIEKAKNDKSKIDENILLERKELLKRSLVEYYLTLEQDPQKALLVYATDKQDIPRIDNLNELTIDRIKQFQRTIEAGSQKIIYLVGENETAVWVVSSTRCEYFPISVGSDVLKGKIEKLRELASAKPSSENQRNALLLSQELYSLIIQPFEQSIEKGSKLLFFSDQSLSLLPYSILMNPVNGELLVKDHQIQEINSLEMAGESLAASEQVASGADKFLGISNPVFDKEQNPGLRSLASADDEVSKIATLFTNPLLLKGEAASPSQVVSGLKRAQIVHFAVHSTVDETDYWQAKVLLSKGKNGEGDSLSAESIRRMKLSNLKLATLSTCSSIGFPGNDGKATGLARAFIDAGVPVVVASLWDIDSKQSADFMSRFYQHYAAGNSPARSLQLSQLEASHSNQVSSGFSIGSAFVVISRN